jgi:hypothetical protein
MLCTVCQQLILNVRAGVIAAVLGAENQSGDFEVADMCFAGLPPQPSSKSSKAKANGKQAETAEDEERDDDPYVALISGLELGTNEEAPDTRVGLLAEWLLGEGADEDVCPTPPIYMICADIQTQGTAASPENRQSDFSRKQHVSANSSTCRIKRHDREEAEEDVRLRQFRLFIRTYNPAGRIYQRDMHKRGCSPHEWRQGSKWNDVTSTSSS